MKFTLIMAKKLSIYHQLVLEEALLRTSNENICLLSTSTPPSVVMGISAKPEEHLEKAFFSQNEIALIRRFSGGGTVIVDENSFFVTCIMNRQELTFPCYPENLMEFIEKPVSKAFKEIKLLQNDFVIGNKKCAGNAQMLTKDRALHHISFLWDFCTKRMGFLKHPKRIPKYRADRNHLDFLIPLKNTFADKEKLIPHFSQAFASLFEIDKTLTLDMQTEKGVALFEHITKPEHRRATVLMQEGKIELHNYVL